MIRALLKKQLLELGAAFVRSSKTGKRRSRAGAFGYALLFAVLMLLVMLSFGSMALPLAVTLVPQGLDWLYFVLMELSALTVSVLASAFTSYGHLFRCRDNQQLLALPIPPGAIFAVRCGGVYLTGLIYLLLAWVPSVVCYALAAPRPGGALLAALPVALALAGVSMVLAVLLGWAVALLNRRAQHKSLVTVVGTLLFLAVYYAAFCWVSNAVEALAVDAGQFVFTGSAVLNSCLLECVVKFRPARRQLHNSGCFIPFGAAIADLHLENRLTQASSLPFGGSPPDTWLDRPPAHPSQPYSQLP